MSLERMTELLNQSMNQLMTSVRVCRTAPATLGLVNTNIIFSKLGRSQGLLYKELLNKLSNKLSNKVTLFHATVSQFRHPQTVRYGASSYKISSLAQYRTLKKPI